MASRQQIKKDIYVHTYCFVTMTNFLLICIEFNWFRWYMFTLVLTFLVSSLLRCKCNFFGSFSNFWSENQGKIHGRLNKPISGTNVRETELNPLGSILGLYLQRSITYSIVYMYVCKWWYRFNRFNLSIGIAIDEPIRSFRIVRNKRKGRTKKKN